MLKRLEVWLPIGLSSIAILISALSLSISYDQVEKGAERFDIARNSENAEISLRLIDGTNDVEMSVIRRVMIVNSSTNPAAIASVRCNSHPYVGRAMKVGRTIIRNGCQVYVRREDDNYSIAEGPINFQPGETKVFRLQAKLPAPDTTKQFLEKYLKDQPKFDEQDFLLFLARQGSDFFGTTFGASYEYLQQNIGQNLCLGASATLEAVSATQNRLEYGFDYYVGPMMPPVSCSGRSISLEYSDAFRDDLFDPSQMSPLDTRLLEN